MQQALDHAERVQPAWGEIAYTALVDYASARHVFNSYTFRKWFHAMGYAAPPTDKAFGAIFSKAARNGVIERIGYDPHPERHASPTPRWRSLVAP